MENRPVLDGDQITTVRVALIIAFVLVSAIGGCTTYNVNQDRVIAAGIEKGIATGADPIRVACAYRPPTDAARCGVTP